MVIKVCTYVGSQIQDLSGFMKVTVLFLLLVFAGWHQAAGQDNTTIPSHVNLDTTKVDEVFDRYSDDTPGCALGIAHKGELIYSNGYGMANLEHDIPITCDTRFLIASISKQFAAAALLVLEDQGELDLDEDLRTYIPELPDFGSTVTARQLIHHTSGIRDLFHLLYINGRGLDPETPDSLAMEMIANQRDLNFEPGSRHIYSNAGYFLISVLVKNISGQSLAEFTEEHLFGPSGMENTHFHDDFGKIVPNRSLSYRPVSGGYGLASRGNIERVGARGLFTTIEDMAKWDRNFYENKTPISDFKERMTEPGRVNNNNSLNYATGLRLNTYKTYDTVGHGGWYMGFRTNYTRFKDKDLSIIVFCNSNHISPASHTYDVADVLLKDSFNEVFEPYAGVYENRAYGVRYRIELEDGDLVLDRPDDPKGELSWEDDDEFSISGWILKFEKNSDGQYDRFILETNGIKKLTFTRTDDE